MSRLLSPFQLKPRRSAAQLQIRVFTELELEVMLLNDLKKCEFFYPGNIAQWSGFK